MTEQARAVELLEQVAIMIESPGGWCQHVSGDVKSLDGAHDVYGAMEAVLLAWGLPASVYWLAREPLAALVNVGERTITLADWNDATSQTAHGVATMVRRAAENLRGAA